VVFSVIVQSLTLERLIVRLGYGRPMPSGEADAESPAAMVT
jgi:hypothetical protein